jgi:hypothetical protein
MSETRPLPEFWYPLARILLVLKALLAATAPEAFGAISAHVHRELRYVGAYLRRFLLALARRQTLPPLRPRLPSAAPEARRRSICLTARFSVSEPPVRRAPGRRSVPSPAPAEWALALSRAEAMLAILRRPLTRARRLARRLEQRGPHPLRDLAVPAHILRVIAPALDTLLMRLDCLARPDLWAGLDPDTG